MELEIVQRKVEGGIQERCNLGKAIQSTHGFTVGTEVLVNGKGLTALAARLTTEQSTHKATDGQNRYMHLLAMDKKIFCHRSVVMFP